MSLIGPIFLVLDRLDTVTLVLFNYQIDKMDTNIHIWNEEDAAQSSCSPGKSMVNKSSKTTLSAIHCQSGDFMLTQQTKGRLSI
eukprot:5807694-Amphidinium_carterae.1